MPYYCASCGAYTPPSQNYFCFNCHTYSVHSTIDPGSAAIGAILGFIVGAFAFTSLGHAVIRKAYREAAKVAKTTEEEIRKRVEAA